MSSGISNNIQLVWPLQSSGPTRSRNMFNVHTGAASFSCARTDSLELNIANRQQCASVFAREPSKLMFIVQLVFSFCFERTVFPDGSRYAKSGLSPSWFSQHTSQLSRYHEVATTLAILARKRTASYIATSALIYSVTPLGTLVP